MPLHALSRSRGCALLVVLGPQVETRIAAEVLIQVVSCYCPLHCSLQSTTQYSVEDQRARLTVAARFRFSQPPRSWSCSSGLGFRPRSKLPSPRVIMLIPLKHSHARLGGLGEPGMLPLRDRQWDGRSRAGFQSPAHSPKSFTRVLIQPLFCRHLPGDDPVILQSNRPVQAAVDGASHRSLCKFIFLIPLR